MDNKWEEELAEKKALKNHLHFMQIPRKASKFFGCNLTRGILEPSKLMLVMLSFVKLIANTYFAELNSAVDNKWEMKLKKSL